MQILWQVLILFVLKAITKSACRYRNRHQNHGIIWKENPQILLHSYKKFAGYGSARDFEKEVGVIWVPMYGYTKKGVDG